MAETTDKPWIKILIDLKACPEAVEWARGYDTFAAMWKACQRGDWMLWLIGRFCKTEADRKRLVLATCECARLSLKHVPKGETIPLVAIETAEAWAKGGDVTLDQVRAAADDAADAAYAAAAYAAAYAAYTSAAYDAAAYAAYAAAAYAAAYAAYAAYAARSGSLIQSADIVRKHYPDFSLEEKK